MVIDCKRIRLLPLQLAILPALLLAGCTSVPQLPKLSEEGVILAFGDSLTFGHGAERVDAYPAVLARLSGHEVVNAGINGEKSGEGRARLAALLDEVEPELMILCLGGNDMIHQIGFGTIEANLRAMIEMARERHVSVVLLAVPRPGLSLSPPDLYERLADEYAIPIEADVIADVLGDRSLKHDTIHPNAAGYREMAESIYELLQESGALGG